MPCAGSESNQEGGGEGEGEGEVSDIVMPGDTSGRELAQSAVEANPELKVLLTTGMEPSNTDATHGEERFPLLAKPYSADNLARAVRAVLDTGIQN